MTTLVAVMCLAAASTFGQGVAVGLKAGMNFAKIDQSGISASSKTGFHFGGYATIKLPIGIGLQPEAYYSVQGSETSIAAAKAEISTNYLQVPILLRFSPVPVLSFLLGPQFGVLLKAEQTTGSTTIGGVTIPGGTQDLKDQLKSSDLSLAAGVALNLPMGLNVSLRYVKGLSDLNDATGGGSTKSSMFQVSVGYDLFNLGK